MANKAVIGLTGSIGSGKSTVASIFESLGSFIIDTDAEAKAILNQDPQVVLSIVETLGSQVTRPDGSLDRFALRSLIFSDPDAKRFLESLLHPLIRQTALAKAAKAISDNNNNSITLVVPLLFESSIPYPGLSHTVAVLCDRRLSIQRASKRDGCSEQLIEKILDAQMNNDKKRELATFTIDNNDGLEELREKSISVYSEILSNLSKK